MFPRSRHRSLRPAQPKARRNGGSAHVSKPQTHQAQHQDERVDQQTKALLAAIVDSSDDAIVSKDLNGTILSWNKSAERIFGYRADEVIGKPITVIIPPDRLAEEPEVLRRIRLGERIDHYETVRRRKDGSLIDISLTISPLRDSGGKIVGASKIARDITQRKFAERAIEEAQQQLRHYTDTLEERIEERTRRLRETIAELEAFSYSLSHDMRAPLRAIEGFSNAIMEDSRDQLTPRSAEFMAKVITAAQRMDRLILDVLAFTRMSQQPITFEPVDLERLIAEIIRERPEFQVPRAEIEINSPLAPVAGNEASLTQCIVNLLGNAVKFVPEGITPHVRVRTDSHNGDVKLWFEDNGIGIDSAGQQRLFQMFQRLNSGRQYQGTGLGLAIVRKAVERMGGRAGVESEPGKGSRFWLQLPAVK